MHFLAVSLKKYGICAFLLCLACAVRAETWQGTCVSVIDGDSLMVSHESGKKEVRLYGIDTPEFDQPYGRQARAFTRSLVLQKKVTVEPVEIDKYGRTVAKVNTPEGCVNERLIAEGCAWVYKRYCKAGDQKAWSALEQTARQQGVGLWSQPDPTAPWDFRSSKRQAEKKQAKKSVPISSGHFRGNTNSRVLHAPGCTAYDCKNCTAGFDSLGAAMRAGYKPCKKCIDN
jgi:endonuclease YncB( thermonuclease family)